MVYDRFGRKMFGDPYVAKDVLEYVVFEKHITNLYGEWRLHGKIIPDWMPEKEPGRKTYVVKKVCETFIYDEVFFSLFSRFHTYPLFFFW